MFKHILVPTDGSALSRKAIARAVRLAQALKARVTGYYVAPNYSPNIYADYVPRDFVTPKEYEANTRRIAKKYLDVVRQAAARAGVQCKCFYTFSDYPYDAIIHGAKHNRCDVIFMASHGRRGISALLLGSETQKVLTHSKIPVLVCR